MEQTSPKRVSYTCSGVTDERILAVASSKSLSDLVTLNLNGANITGKSIVALADSANYLKELNAELLGDH